MVYVSTVKATIKCDRNGMRLDVVRA